MEGRETRKERGIESASASQGSRHASNIENDPNKGGKAHPERRSHKCEQRRFKPRLLPLRRNTLVDSLPQPDTRPHIPVVKDALEGLGRLESESIDVSTAIPSGSTGDAVVAVEAESAEDDGTWIREIASDVYLEW